MIKLGLYTKKNKKGLYMKKVNIKKVVVLLMIAIFCVLFCACEANKQNVNSKNGSYNNEDDKGVKHYLDFDYSSSKLSLGEKASTDLAEFVLEDCSFTYYASAKRDTFMEPTESGGTYAASIGKCFVSVIFTITNKDRGGSITFAGEKAEWNPCWNVTYKDVIYPVKGYDNKNNSGKSWIDLDYAVILKEGAIIQNESSDYDLWANETVTLRTIGVIDVDPENLTDEFEFTVSVPTSSGGYEYFKYTVSEK